MLKSNICVLNQYNYVDSRNTGECKYDAGGYFIINGSEGKRFWDRNGLLKIEFIVIIYQKMRQNIHGRLKLNQFPTSSVFHQNRLI